MKVRVQHRFLNVRNVRSVLEKGCYIKVWISFLAQTLRLSSQTTYIDKIKIARRNRKRLRRIPELKG